MGNLLPIQIVGYDFDMVSDLSTVVEIDEERILKPHSIYLVLTEQGISDFKNSLEYRLNKKLTFLYQHLDKELLEGKKTSLNMKF